MPEKKPAVEVKPGQVWADKRFPTYMRQVLSLEVRDANRRVVVDPDQQHAATHVRCRPVLQTQGHTGWMRDVSGRASSVGLARLRSGYRLVQDAPASPEVQDD